MSKKILIDAAYAGEVRLVLVEDGVVKAFDCQTKEKKNQKGDVYLVKVTRVEPALQAAFVEYGAEKQGFLPFSEIHPDYYQIPVEDRQALLKQIDLAKQRDSDIVDNNGEYMALDVVEEQVVERPTFYKQYRIQEVIKKDQVLLVQITKEARGNKGAAVTTYISLAGRYCVLMPNATQAGGVSRKIVDSEERARLKQLLDELNEADGGRKTESFIIRTASVYKTKTEIKRDLAYLRRLWRNICEHALSSTAPTFIHEEGDIIKRAIRDQYNGEIEEIIVSGSEAYNNAKNFIKLLLPRHIDKVIEYKEKLPIFIKYYVEEQLSNLYSSVVALKSGGYIVINQTEALVAIDVNSGKSTSERSIEDTALKSNIEAAQVIALQLRLRDLSGLIVVDFIDMEEISNRRAVERVLKDALAADKARTQVGKISEFGLLEMSRQRLRQSFNEVYMLPCQNCDGRGKVRPNASTVVAIMRAIANELAISSDEEGEYVVSASQELILYILNNNKVAIMNLERMYGVKLSFAIDNSAGGDGFFIEKAESASSSVERQALSAIDVEPYVMPNKDNLLENTILSDKREWHEKSNKVFSSEVRAGGALQQNMNGASKKRKKLRKSRRSMVSSDHSEKGGDVRATVVKRNYEEKLQGSSSLLMELWRKIMD